MTGIKVTNASTAVDAAELRDGKPTQPRQADTIRRKLSKWGARANHYQIGVLAMLIVLAASAVANTWVDRDDLSSLAVAEGITVFAIPLLLAQAVERLIEPLASGFSDWKEDAAKQQEEAAEEVSLRHQQLSVATAKGRADVDDEVLAYKQATRRRDGLHEDVKTIERNRAIWIWSLATVISTAVCAAVGFSFLELIGVDPVVGGEYADLLVTGLIVGSGTKPLHELISRLESKPAEPTDLPSPPVPVATAPVAIDIRDSANATAGIIADKVGRLLDQRS